MYFAHFLNKVLEKGIYLERYRRDEVKGAIESSRASKDYVSCKARRRTRYNSVSSQIDQLKLIKFSRHSISLIKWISNVSFRKFLDILKTRHIHTYIGVGETLLWEILGRFMTWQSNKGQRSTDRWSDSIPRATVFKCPRAETFPVYYSRLKSCRRPGYRRGILK